MPISVVPVLVVPVSVVPVLVFPVLVVLVLVVSGSSCCYINLYIYKCSLLLIIITLIDKLHYQILREIRLYSSTGVYQIIIF